MEETVHDDFFKNFTVVTATVSAIEDLPKTSGVYAFYHAFDFLETNLSDDIDTRVKKTVFKPKFSQEDNKTKFIVDTRGKSVGLSRHMGKFIEAVSQPKERRMLKNLLIYCSIFQRPEYIGTASNLRNRFIEHLETDNGFFYSIYLIRSKNTFSFYFKIPA
jgi:hypothetical protein